MKAYCKVNWDYGFTMSVAILLTQRAKCVNQIYFISCRFCSCENFQLYNKWLVFFRCMNVELQIHIKVGCQAILRTKPCTSLNLVRLITAKVTHKKFLGMSDYQASSNPRICFVFYNNAPQSKAVTVNNKRKIFSFLTRPS